VGHLLLATVFTMYIVLAVKYSEEPALIRELGPQYKIYMRNTPCYIPQMT